MYSAPVAPPQNTHFRNKYNYGKKKKRNFVFLPPFFAEIDICHGIVGSTPQQHFEGLKFKFWLNVLTQTHSLSPLLLLSIA